MKGAKKGNTAAPSSSSSSVAASPSPPPSVAAAVAPRPASSHHHVSLVDLTTIRSPTDTSFLHTSPSHSEVRDSPYLIVDVWADNMRSVFEKIQFLVEEYPYIALDTEFPGVIVRPLTTNTSTQKQQHSYHYQTIKLNVDCMRLIQLGLCFCTSEGEIARGTPGIYPPATNSATPIQLNAAAQPGGIVYQFHFKFNLNDEMYAADSIELLQQSGLDLARHASQGIDVTEFAELLMISGIVLNEDVRWLSFHSGFDFAYLLHLLLGGGLGTAATDSTPTLPANEQEFFELLTIYFPYIYDIKALVKSGNHEIPEDYQHGGLNRLASLLHLGRIGRQHQAGSDALLTASVFFKLRQEYFSDIIPPTMQELQENAAAASAVILKSDKTAATTSKDASDDAAAATTDSTTSATTKEQRDRERDAYIAATDSTSALVNSFHKQEEKYLGQLYGLAPIANSLVKTMRDKERAQTSGTANDDTTSTSQPINIPRRVPSSSPTASSSAFKPLASSGSPPNFADR